MFFFSELMQCQVSNSCCDVLEIHFICYTREGKKMFCFSSELIDFNKSFLEAENPKKINKKVVQFVKQYTPNQVRPTSNSVYPHCKQWR